MASVRITTRNRVNKEGLTNILIRVTSNRTTKYYKTDVFVNPDKFSNGKISGRGPKVAEKNRAIQSTFRKAESILNNFIYEGKAFSFPAFEAKYLNNKSYSSIIEFWEGEKPVICNTISKSRGSRYQVLINTLQNLFGNFTFSDLSLALINKLDYALHNRGINQNTISQYHKAFRALINRAILQGFIRENPYTDFRIKTEPGKREFLSLDEVNQLETYLLSDRILIGHKSLLPIFLFACYTGIRYNDLQALEWSHISNDYIYIKQGKTSDSVLVPISERAKKHLPVKDPLQKKVFTLISNQKANDHLKEIAQKVGINKKLSFHVSRHTFATISLQIGIPLEVVSELLGHKDLKTTKIYAKIVAEHKKREMDKWNF